MKLDLRIDEVLPHSVQKVWAALTDQRLLARWLMENDFEPRVGHRFTLRDPPTDSWRGWIECEVLELNPPRRMVWSWNGGAPGESTSRLVFEVSAEGAGARLVLRHLGGDASQDQSASLRSGWTRKLGRLSGALEPDYGRRVAFQVSRTEVFAAIAQSNGLREWWTPWVPRVAPNSAELHFDLEGTTDQFMVRIDESVQPSSIRWTCLVHTRFDDWAGTKFHFELLDRDAKGCELYLRHEGLTSDLKCYEICARDWKRLLASLVSYVEIGKGASVTRGSESAP